MRFLTPAGISFVALALAGASFTSQSKRASSAARSSPEAAEMQSSATRHPERDQRLDFDRGIYTPREVDAESMCAAITSYNFTPGERPRLESVTTCTPAGTRTLYRAKDKRAAPEGPVLDEISVPASGR